MANESLNSLSAVIEQDIPQTLEEKLVQSSPVIEKDIPQTLDEKISNVTPVIEKDIPQTLEEKLLQSTVVIGQESDRKRSVLFKSGMSNYNQSSNSNLWIDKGIVKVVAQPLLMWSQIMV